MAWKPIVPQKLITANQGDDRRGKLLAEYHLPAWTLDGGSQTHGTHGRPPWLAAVHTLDFIFRKEFRDSSAKATWF